MPGRSQKSSNWPPSPLSILSDKPGRTRHSDTNAKGCNTSYSRSKMWIWVTQRWGQQVSPLQLHRQKKGGNNTYFEGIHAPALLHRCCWHMETPPFFGWTQTPGMHILKFWPYRKIRHLDTCSSQSRTDPEHSMYVVIGWFCCFCGGLFLF